MRNEESRGSVIQMGDESKRLRVLVVDDDASQIDVVARGLRADGFAVASATCPIGVSAVVATLAPDVVLVDLAMATLSGTRLLQLLREGAPPTTLLVCFSASDERTLRRSAAESHADGWLSKSLTVPDIAARLRRMCSARASC